MQVQVQVLLRWCKCKPTCTISDSISTFLKMVSQKEGTPLTSWSAASTTLAFSLTSSASSSSSESEGHSASSSVGSWCPAVIWWGGMAMVGGGGAWGW